MQMLQSVVTLGPCASYARGLCDGRRTAEAELEAERDALAILAKSLSAAAKTLTLYLHPDDMAHVEGPTFDIRIAPDVRLGRGAIRLQGDLA